MTTKAKPAIVKAIEMSEEDRVWCPRCAGQGLVDSASNQLAQPVVRDGKLIRKGMPFCPLCKGNRVLYLNHICECGSPSVRIDGKTSLWYCGRDICLNAKLFRTSQTPVMQWEGC